EGLTDVLHPSAEKPAERVGADAAELRLLAALVPEAHVDVAARPGVALVPLGHERDGVPLLPGDLLRRVLVDRVPVRHLQRLGISQPDLLLPRPPLALRRLDRHAAALEMRADRADDVLLFRPLQDVVVLDHAPDRRGVDEALLRDLLVRVLEDIELELRRGHDAVAALRRARELA